MLKNGVSSAIRCWPAAVWTFVATALSALPIALAVGSVFHKHLAQSADAETYARGLDPTMVLSVLLAHDSAVDVVIAVFGGLIVLWAIASTYLAGATISAINAPRTTSTHDFYSGGGRVFGRLLRLLAFAGPFWVLVVGLPGYGLYKGFDVLTRDWVSERSVLFVRLAALAIVLLLVFWANGACDLMRVEAVARGEHRARFAFWRGLVRAVKRPFAPLVIAVTFGGAILLVTLLHSLFDAHFARSSMFWIVIGFLLQQMIAFARAFLRVAALASAVELQRPGP